MENWQSYFDGDIEGIPKDYYLSDIAQLEIDLANYSNSMKKYMTMSSC